MCALDINNSGEKKDTPNIKFHRNISVKKGFYFAVSSWLGQEFWIPFVSSIRATFHPSNELAHSWISHSLPLHQVRSSVFFPCQKLFTAQFISPTWCFRTRARTKSIKCECLEYAMCFMTFAHITRIFCIFFFFDVVNGKLCEWNACDIKHVWTLNIICIQTYCLPEYL